MFRNFVISIAGIFSFLIVVYISATSEQSIRKYVFVASNFLIASCLVLYFSSTTNNKNRFLKNIHLILRIILFHSLINFLIYPFVKESVVDIVFDPTGYDCEMFGNVFFYEVTKNEITFLGITFCRNQGFFWEPAILQLFLNVLLFFELFVFSAKRKMFLVLAVVGVLTTYSTTGYLILLLQLMFFFSKKLKKGLIIVPIAVLLMIPVYQIIQDNVENKLYGGRSTSAKIRLYDLVQPLLIIKEHPLTGIGLDGESYSKERMSYGVSIEELEVNKKEKGNTNAVLFLMSAAGLPFSFLVLLSLFSQNIFCYEKKIMFLIFFITILAEPILLKPFFLFFVMSGMFKLIERVSWGRKF